MEARKIQIFDTTLRDGEQTPGVSLQTEEKVEIALALAKLKVDVIEAGFPVASPGDFEAVSQIAAKVKGPTIAALARANERDIEAAYKAIKKAEKPRIHTFIATSDIHLEHKLKMTRAELLNRVEKAVSYAKSLVADVEFSAEDASRSDWDFLCQVYEKAIAAGANVINIPDTVGYTTPVEFGALITYIREHVPNIEEAVISVHCHDDLGMAVANSLAAIAAGASQVECTINGLGERAGNAAMEELVMALQTRREYYQACTAINTQQIYRTSRLVSTLTGIAVPPNKAVVGDNAFAHESGIHQHGVLNNPLTYEIMSPEAVGISRNAIVLGKHSGRHAFEERLKHLGYEIDTDTINTLFAKFKELADRKKMVFDKDIEALVAEKAAVRPEWYTLAYHHVASGNQTLATASVQLRTSAGLSEAASCGNGPVDAVIKAVEQAVGFPIGLKDYQLKAVTAGEDALGEATVWIERDDHTFSGRGLSIDVIEASAKAYVSAINKMLAVCGFPAVEQAAGR
ncbi:2-isopropylmalate synthase [Sporomusa acidovorans]|uniref:2-isopropylmalate synthase n=1 Tax=Sporomusa acidovorans (strain ATCC 49682 / DSM 3132 / Mol) TaxID=1123286 RepID=A0ABZ3JA16_SPOA4|nr:2-isopropylmalate synthase [Sporomusa acidovorans]OZC21646.1 2-isopropylmalate synthase [Sporomusa acidovorans DSM 3132]SDD61313.1 2-isopropylmalate synthase [Sporomusa acidovorans]